MESIANRIKEIRIKYNMNQRNFSEQIGISQAALSDIEKGKTKPSIDTVISMSKKFEISTDWILRGDPSSNVTYHDNEVINSLFIKLFNNLAEFYSVLTYDERELLSNLNSLDNDEKVQVLLKLRDQISEK